MRLSSPLIGLIVFAGWVAGEIGAYNLVSGVVGGSATLFLFLMKPVLGLLFVQRMLRRKLAAMMERGGGFVILDGGRATDAWLKGLGGILLVVPGFLAGAIGLALLTPAVRRFIAARSPAPPQDLRDIELDAGDWREVPDPERRRLPDRENARP